MISGTQASRIWSQSHNFLDGPGIHIFILKVLGLHIVVVSIIGFHLIQTLLKV